VVSEFSVEGRKSCACPVYFLRFQLFGCRRKFSTIPCHDHDFAMNAKSAPTRQGDEQLGLIGQTNLA
jgi:hypothetical protein